MVRITTHSKLRSKMHERTSIFNDPGIINLYCIAVASCCLVRFTLYIVTVSDKKDFESIMISNERKKRRASQRKTRNLTEANADTSNQN